MKMRIHILLALVLALVFGCSGVAMASDNLVIASGNPGGTYYYIGAGMAKILSRKIPGVEFTTEATTGSPVENGTYTSESAETLGIFTLDGAYAAMKGDPSRGFRKPITNIGMIQGGHDLLLYWVTLKDNGINSFSDLKGKRVGIPVAGNTAYFQAMAVLEVYGIGKDDFKGVPMTYAEQADALKDGNLDAMCTGGGIPQAAAMDVSMTKDAVFLSIEEDKFAALKEKYPYWWISQIPVMTYRGQYAPVNVFTSQVCLFANLDMPEELAYKITKALSESTDELKEVHAEGSKWSSATTKRMYDEPVVPFHPGAKKYYDELWGKK